MIDLSIIVPCYNEENNIKGLVLKILDLFNDNKIQGEIILINDGSHDGTGTIILDLQGKFKNVFGIRHEINSGIAESWHSGLKQSKGKYVLTIDADFQYNPGDILLLYREIKEERYDLVQGWRREYKDKDLVRRFLSRSLSLALNLVSLTALHDIKSGFAVYKKAVFSDILEKRKNYRTFQHFFILCALKNGYRLKQVPVSFYPRMKGNSFIRNPIAFSFKVFLDIPRAFIDFGFAKKIRNRRGFS